MPTVGFKKPGLVRFTDARLFCLQVCSCASFSDVFILTLVVSTSRPIEIDIKIVRRVETRF